MRRVFLNPISVAFLLVLWGMLASCASGAPALTARPANTSTAAPAASAGPASTAEPSLGETPAPPSSWHNGDWFRLAWFYKPPEDGNLELLVRYFKTFILTQKDEDTRASLQRSGVPQPILQYFLLLEIQDPGSCDEEPYGNQVAFQMGDFCRISEEHPDWFLLDQQGQRMVAGKMVMMDPGNPGYWAFWLERVRWSQQALGWEGVFADNIEASFAKRQSQGQLPALYPDEASYQAAIAGFLAYLQQGYFGPEGRPLWGNIISLESSQVWQSYLAHLDGAMIESFAVDWDNGYLGRSEWETEMDLIDWAQANDKELILVAQGPQDNLKRQRFALASYLLVNQGKSSFRYASDKAYNQVWWYDNYTLDLGLPLGSRYLQDGIWLRNFEKGVVWVDPGEDSAGIELVNQSE